MMASSKDKRTKEKGNETQDIAYLVKTKQQLDKMNRILGTNEKVYPALYVKMLGTLVQTDTWRASYMKNVGYKIIRI